MVCCCFTMEMTLQNILVQFNRIAEKCTEYVDMGVVYLIKNKVNNKCYVGITTRKIHKRIYQHFSKQSTCRLLKRSIEKYGKDNFTYDVLEECDNELLCEREVKYIRQYNSFVGWDNGGMNLTTGGELKKEVAQETKVIWY